jgi:hypothetical protein
MKNRESYEAALAVVKSVVHEWDPYGLLASGAPLDEFDAEIARVTTHLPRIHTAQDAVRALSAVFSDAFDADAFGPETCASPAKLLFTRLKDAGLLGHEFNATEM